MTSSRAHSATAPRGSRTRCGPDLGRTAADRQPLDRRGDGEGRLASASVRCRRIWRAHGLRPHLVRRFKLSHDPQFAAKLKEIVGLYINPPNHAIVLSVDEKSQIQALDRTQPQAVPIIEDASDEPQAEFFFKSALRDCCLNLTLPASLAASARGSP